MKKAYISKKQKLKFYKIKKDNHKTKVIPRKEICRVKNRYKMNRLLRKRFKKIRMNQVIIRRNME